MRPLPAEAVDRRVSGGAWKGVALKAEDGDVAWVGVLEAMEPVLLEEETEETGARRQSSLGLENLQSTVQSFRHQRGFPKIHILFSLLPLSYPHLRLQCI